MRILDGRAATSAVTRVMLTSADADGEWTTVGVSDDIVTASWEALTDGVVFGLLRAGRRAARRVRFQLGQPGTPHRAAEHEISEAASSNLPRPRSGPLTTGPSRAAARAMLRAVGLSEEDLSGRRSPSRPPGTR